MAIRIQNHSSNYNEKLNLKIKSLARKTKEYPFIFGWLVFYVFSLLSVVALLLLIYPRMQDYSQLLESAELQNVPIIKPKLPHFVEVPEQLVDNSDNILFQQLQDDKKKSISIITRPNAEEPLEITKPSSIIVNNKNQNTEDNKKETDIENNPKINSINIIENIVNKASNQITNTLPTVPKIAYKKNDQSLLPKALNNGNWAIQLGSFKSQIQAEQAWTNIIISNSKTSQFLLPFYTNSIVGDEIYIRLQSGYFSNQENAKKWCLWFIKNNQPCLSVPVSLN